MIKCPRPPDDFGALVPAAQQRQLERTQLALSEQALQPLDVPAPDG